MLGLIPRPPGSEADCVVSFPDHLGVMLIKFLLLSTESFGSRALIICFPDKLLVSFPGLRHGLGMRLLNYCHELGVLTSDSSRLCQLSSW